MIRHGIHLPSGFVAGLMALVCTSSGCLSGPYYRPGNLPLNLEAPPQTNIQNLDLSRLSRSVGRSDVIQPGDVLEVAITTGIESGEHQKRALRVADDGTLNVPLVGPVPVAGLEPTQAERSVYEASVQRGTYRNPQVSLLLTSKRMFRVTVVGAVKNPGECELLPTNCDLVAAIVAAGGLEEDAGTEVEIRHPPRPAGDLAAWGGVRPAGFPPTTPGVPTDPLAPRFVHLNLDDVAVSSSGDFHLEDGSIVKVSRRPSQAVAVLGLVRQPKNCDIPLDRDLRLLEAISIAGGRTMEIANKVQITRLDPATGERVVIRASVHDAKLGGPDNLRLAPGDVVSVEETPLTFVVGTLREFVRFGFSGGVTFF